MAAVIKKALHKVIASPGHSPTSSAHDAEGVISPTTPTRSHSSLHSDTLSHTPASSSRTADSDSGHHTPREGGRKPNRVSTLLSHIRSHSTHSKASSIDSTTHPDGGAANGHIPNGAVVTAEPGAHGDTVHAHEIVRPSTQRRLSMTEEKEQRKVVREEKEETEAERRRQKHIEAWKNVRRPLSHYRHFLPPRPRFPRIPALALFPPSFCVCVCVCVSR